MSAPRLTQIFGQILQTQDVGEKSDFFELGGDSLLATRVLSAVAREFSVELTFEDFVESPSPEALFAKIVDTSWSAGQCV